MESGLAELAIHFENRDLLLGCNGAPFKFPKNQNLYAQRFHLIKITDVTQRPLRCYRQRIADLRRFVLECQGLP